MAKRKVKCDFKSFRIRSSEWIKFALLHVVVAGNSSSSRRCFIYVWLTTISFCNFFQYIGNKRRKDKYLMNANTQNYSKWTQRQKKKKSPYIRHIVSTDSMVFLLMNFLIFFFFDSCFFRKSINKETSSFICCLQWKNVSFNPNT